MKLHIGIAAATFTAALLVSLASLAVVTAEAQTTDPRVADLVRVGKLRVGLFLPQFGKGPGGLTTTVWVEAARAYAARVGVPLVIVEHATPPEAIACLNLETMRRSENLSGLNRPTHRRRVNSGNFVVT